MVPTLCKNQNCTVAETGICLELNTLEDCPFIVLSNDEQAIINPDTAISQIIDEQIRTSQSAAARRFHSGNELGSQDAIKIMQGRYTYLVGILGSANVGKTCLLSSLYLLVSQAELMPKYQFAGSLTLQGYEERARGLRAWQNAHLPDQVVENTHLQDPRQPAFMHLCLYNTDSQKKLDILFTDLPGEWTDDLITQEATASRVDFLQRADGILYLIDGPNLNNAETRGREVYRAKIAVDRLVANVNINKEIPFIFVISKGDEIDMKLPKSIDPILEHARQLGIAPIPILITSFSRKPTLFKSGAGIIDTVKLVIESTYIRSESPKVMNSVGRSFWHV